MSQRTNGGKRTSIVRVHSHRADERLNRLLGFQPQGYYSFAQEGRWREVPSDKLAEVLQIKGITKSKLPTTAHKCWAMTLVLAESNGK